MANYSPNVNLAAHAGVFTGLPVKEAKTEIPFVVLDGESSTKPALSLTDPLSLESLDSAPCCPLAELVNKLQPVLQALSALRERPPGPARLMRTLHRQLENIDRAYLALEESIKLEMATLQLPMLDESNEREALVSFLKCVVEPENFDEVVAQVLAGGGSREGTILEEVISRHPEIEVAIQSLAKHQRTASSRFQQLQRQLDHASQHRISERKEIAELLQEYGLNKMSKKMKTEACLLEMGWYGFGAQKKHS